LGDNVLIRIGIDHGDRRAALGEHRRESGGRRAFFPAPPLGELTAITGMASLFRE
jgi:hypothetical protein